MSRLFPTRFIPWLAAIVPIGLSACNQYEMFLVTGDEQVAFNGKVDVLFVVDNSLSLTSEASALMANFDTFIDKLAGEDGYGQQTENLSDAVGDYITFTSNRAEAIDYNLAVTTHQINTRVGTPGIRGLFVGDDPVISRSDPDGRLRFLQNVGCWSTCWGGDPDEKVESDGTFNCTANDPDLAFPESGTINTQYLDCLCSEIDYGASQNDGAPYYNDWTEPCLGGEPDRFLEASLLSMCRAVENPPEVCWHAGSVLDEPQNGTADWIMTNKGWLRPDSKVLVVIITDAHDDSDTNLSGLQPASNPDVPSWNPQPYLDAFDSFNRPISFVVIGPDLPCEDDSCDVVCRDKDEDAVTRKVQRLRNMALATGGIYRSITLGDAPLNTDCEVADFATHLDEIGQLMLNLQTVFALRAVPEESSLRVYVDGEEIDKAKPLSSGSGANTMTFGDAYDDGWAYDPGQNAVVFWGDAVPDFNQDVEIFYRPLDGNPRELPF